METDAVVLAVAVLLSGCGGASAQSQAEAGSPGGRSDGDEASAAESSSSPPATDGPSDAPVSDALLSPDGTPVCSSSRYVGAGAECPCPEPDDAGVKNLPMSACDVPRQVCAPRIQMPRGIVFCTCQRGQWSCAVNAG